MTANESLIEKLKSLAWTERAPGGGDEQVLYLTDAINAASQEAEALVKECQDSMRNLLYNQYDTHISGIDSGLEEAAEIIRKRFGVGV